MAGPRLDKDALMKKKVAELREIARRLALKTPAKMRKDEMVRMILEKAEGEAPVEQPAAPKTIAPVPGPRAATDPYGDLPAGYGANRISALARDPAWIFVYWEVTPEGFADGRERLRDQQARLTLRVYDRSSQENLSVFFDIEVYHRIGSWYIDVGQGGRTYLVDVGLKSAGGSYATLARSNPASTPSGRISDDLSEEWWVVEDGETAGSFLSEPGRRLPKDLLAEWARAELAASDTVARYPKQRG